MRTATSSRRAWSLPGRALTSAGAIAPVLSPTEIRFKAMHAARTQNQSQEERGRRALNIAVAVLGIILTAPVMLAVALLVRLTSRGPVIYKQHRVGVDRRLSRGPGSMNHRRRADRGGRIFTIYKFRTMRVDQGTGARQVWASKHDPRITPVGRFLRATRLDELPQLFNVLQGDMNIVGPRPEQPEIFANLQEELGHYRNRQRVLPGITGLAQIELGYDTDIEGVKKKVSLDLEYIQRRSAAKDLLIMARTVPVMVFQKVWM